MLAEVTFLRLAGFANLGWRFWNLLAFAYQNAGTALPVLCQLPPRVMRPVVLALLLIAALEVLPVHADAVLSSLVGGYCRIGKYTPVEVKHNGTSEFRIEVVGALPVHVRAGPRATSVVPVLTIAQPTGVVTIHSAGDTRVEVLPFRVVSDAEMLVGIIGIARAEDVQYLFPNKQLISIFLDRLAPFRERGRRGKCWMPSSAALDESLVQTTLLFVRCLAAARSW